ncbi:hypothetical protein SAMN04487950_4054 [Halogranum rubrum]|uniref:Uncharacterized protein n=1 Tax=Halogranum rubrum TaxID=553466 RepID=A0A1I4IAH2_9EURY|nr:hypothetical protein [Halogranum rubrum]SFL50761.1 hypothetical protein SAMN04487950_4054 [Halogranum rubrum]
MSGDTGVEHRQVTARAVRDGIVGAVGDLFWTIVAVVAMWVGAAMVLSPHASPNLLGYGFGLFLVVDGVLLLYLVWWRWRGLSRFFETDLLLLNEGR